MSGRRTIIISLFLTFSACADRNITNGILPFSHICGNWRCVYYRVEEQDRRVDQGGYSSREYHYLKEDGGFLRMNADSSYLFTFGLTTDSFAIGRMLAYDSVSHKMSMFTSYGNASGTDITNRYVDEFLWTRESSDTLVLRFKRQNAAKTSEYLVKLLPR
jgi:hypothetical protein